ncbi:hypothetical protein J6590_065820 [Homalodisca vitripennis]|nr:hypothetical protein J6590_065820 [Homalodisca vitripennis]
MFCIYLQDAVILTVYDDAVILTVYDVLYVPTGCGNIDVVLLFCIYLQDAVILTVYDVLYLPTGCGCGNIDRLRYSVFVSSHIMLSLVSVKYNRVDFASWICNVKCCSPDSSCHLKNKTSNRQRKCRETCRLSVSDRINHTPLLACLFTRRERTAG